jgi:hypothetical protein
VTRITHAQLVELTSRLAVRFRCGVQFADLAEDLRSAGVEVEKTPEERIAAFVAELKSAGRPWGCGWLCDLVCRHFPEAKP